MPSLKTLILLIITCVSVYAQGLVYPVGDASTPPNFQSTAPNGFKITQGFDNDVGHTGVDLANGTEGGQIRPIGPGVVTIVSTSTDPSGWGNAVLIRHNLGYGIFYSLYAHMMEGSVRVSNGQSVDSTIVIGQIDCTGNTKGRSVCPSNKGTGPHLHFGIKTVNELGCGYIVPGSCKSDSFANYVGDPLAFIAAHGQSSTPTAQFISFLEGNPGMPGDGLLVTASGPSYLPTFHPTPPIPFSQITDGLTLVIFPPAGTVQSVANINGGFDTSAPDKSGACESGFSSGFPITTFSTVTVNGVQGAVVTLSRASLQSEVAQTEQARSCGFTFNDFVIDAIRVTTDASAATFVTILDALAVSFSQSSPVF